MSDRSSWYHDLLYRQTGEMTPERAFTVAELLAYRLRDDSSDPSVQAALNKLVGALDEIRKSWRS